MICVQPMAHTLINMERKQYQLGVRLNTLEKCLVLNME